MANSRDPKTMTLGECKTELAEHYRTVDEMDALIEMHTRRETEINERIAANDREIARLQADVARIDKLIADAERAMMVAYLFFMLLARCSRS